ncbi:hypothetical protein VTK73DRAFT_8850 [Phialemonium thermophilum]|uniref:Uncharacterized protein n=1 Tax=Phialemonium thermophilum TaxID=223376 RepID=A0ABR3XM98_9PEZI
MVFRIRPQDVLKGLLCRFPCLRYFVNLEACLKSVGCMRLPKWLACSTLKWVRSYLPTLAAESAQTTFSANNVKRPLLVLYLSYEHFTCYVLNLWDGQAMLPLYDIYAGYGSLLARITANLYFHLHIPRHDDTF